ncbi:aconitate hydratase AcnA [Candidatus Methanomassiliicoccus intestinalis]|jgi:aconitate hydratase 1|uniref:aconitate hydratase n=2 Tax=Candidatus Methanomassiliicoccus intestinalis TaxID=1406512 RepID=R9T9Q4_METII|nr:aconitate hydratase AcnA [Candidatus Methanomassiliicoccus intestinalis]AGN26103.1 aconitase [Candidatus Methanomassiliicoccus intestinalis Issoire-Mx1]TQS82225.1 MAG: aconitate hydratase [Candidatus Methanomassiliicoccus intestinalis]TQS84809.1 MAG: aconitate hydratase [Candidatus Methanomassiliicoccus intestinalis]
MNSKFTDTIKTEDGDITIYSLKKLEDLGHFSLKNVPYSIKVLIESILRQEDGFLITEEDVKNAASWSPNGNADVDIPFIPARVILQDFTGVPAVVDLAAMRSAVAALGKDPTKINPMIPVDLVIDHSIQVDYAGTPESQELNEKVEFERNAERYALLKWAQTAFNNFRAVPPGNGIIHQINLEYLSPLIHVKEKDGIKIAYPDSCFGTDSHTTQINGLGVVGWGVGGIEAEAVMLGQPCYMKLPDVIGFKLTGSLKAGVTATDLVLTVVEMLRKKGVVGKFVEFYGPGYKNLEVADRATIANMGPEYGATLGFFPIDEKTLDYLKLSGRDPSHIKIVEEYAKTQGLWYTYEPKYTDTLELDLGTVVPSLAGHKRPQDRIPLDGMKESFGELLSGMGIQKRTINGLSDGSVVIASITSCTNTANPSVMIAAGLLAKKAVEAGLDVKDYVKTSLSPGSKVVTDYLRNSGLLQYLEKLRFHVTGYGCMTCIGNSGPLRDDIRSTIKDNDLVAAAVVSANRNFEGRVSPYVKANYLASPPLVIAFAIAGRVDIDLDKEPLGVVNGKEVFLRDIWPDDQEINSLIEKYVTSETFKLQYNNIFKGSFRWDDISIPEGALYAWDEKSTYIQNPPFFNNLTSKAAINNISNARALASLGDSITTDHISPAGEFSDKSDAGKYLISLGIKPADFNSYGSRRGNHEIMMRGTFANIRLRNKIAPGTEGGYSRHMPDGENGTMFEISQKYISENTPLIVIAGKEYGTGSSRDWAAKGPFMLGIKAVIAESFERIHRSNLIGMGIIPLQFIEGENAESLGLDGTETFDIELENMTPKSIVTVTASKNGKKKQFKAMSRVDVPAELEYIKNGGILQTVLRKMISE